MSMGICDAKSAKYIGLFVVGAGIGAGLALLFAPRTGKDTRRYLARRAEEGKEYVSNTSRDLLRQAEDAVDRGKGWASKLAH
ncbi:MAG: YtxH domain-containing protein [Acidobacteria bacterium]|nr:YtxH domain-containing protein [Acidobacteriota bacterium]